MANFSGFMAIGNVTAAGVFTECVLSAYARKAINFTRSMHGQVQGIGNPISFTTTAPTQTNFNAFAFYPLVTTGNPALVYPTVQPFSFGIKTSPFLVSPPSIVVNYLDAVTGDGVPIDSGGASIIAGIDELIQNFSASNGITAFAGGGQASAALLASSVNRVTTVATSGDSVKLPPAVAGDMVTIVNTGANPCQVYGSGTDTINAVATATGVSQPINSVDTYWCPVVGAWYAEVGGGFSAGMFTESSKDNITAFAGGGQTSAVALTTQTVRVTVVASSGDSVKLPASAPGLELIIINHGANTLQVYGAGTDTIDDVATATGVSQMVSSMCIYTCATAGAWYSNGLGTGYSGSLPTESFKDNITAFATGGQASATQMTTVFNRFTTVASAGDSAKLPVSAGGLNITVANASANSMNVFPQTGDQINALGVNVAFAVGAGKSASFGCAGAGTWHSILSV